ncbi:DUF4437 domain-containing protein [Parasphingorhabdus sp.]|uniref:DUF4437 domain-containing protein n=1 Tax=Parasphingorhabdus sp. TaxID=2709688 RepID=UPI003A92DCBF
MSDRGRSIRRAGTRAGNLWGDHTTEGASGFPVQFDEDFASPPHIHNITYPGSCDRGLGA